MTEPTVSPPTAGREPWRCPRRGHENYLNPYTATWLPRTCRSIRCPACIVGLVYEYATAIAFAAPRYLLTIEGGVRGSWDEDARWMDRLVRWFRRESRTSFEHAWAVERNPNGTGYHVHAYVHTPHPRGADLLRRLSRAAGGVDVNVKPFATPEPPASGGPPRATYLAKVLLDRPEGVTTLWPGASEHLELNGGRMAHSTNGFFRAGRSGRHVGDWRAAATLAKQQWYEHGRSILAAA